MSTISKEERARLAGLYAEVLGHAREFGGVLGAAVSGPELSIEAHGSGEAIYVGRGRNAHGLNVAHVTEPAYQWPNVRPLIVAAVNALPRLLDSLDAAEARDAALGVEIGNLTSRIVEQEARIEELTRERDEAQTAFDLCRESRRRILDRNEKAAADEAAFLEEGIGHMDRVVAERDTALSRAEVAEARIAHLIAQAEESARWEERSAAAEAALEEAREVLRDACADTDTPRHARAWGPGPRSIAAILGKPSGSRGKAILEVVSAARDEVRRDRHVGNCDCGVCTALRDLDSQDGGGR